MPRSLAALTLITLLFLVSGAWATRGVFHAHDLPFSLSVVDAQTAQVYPNAGAALPPGIQVGDEVDLSALDPSARAAVAIYDLQGSLPPDQTYQFVVRRDGTSTVVPVTTTPIGLSARGRVSQWIFLANYLLMAVLALLVLWRGRDRAAACMAAWLTLTLVGFGFNYGFALDSIPGLCMQFLAIGCYVVTRMVFYLMIETLLGAALGPRARLIARTSLALVIAVGVSTLLGGHLLYAMSAWAGLLYPAFGIVFSAGYVVPALALLFGYGHAVEAQKPQLRWVLLSLSFLLVSVFVSNSQVLDIVTSQVVQSISIAFGISGFAYAILRHRMLDVRVVLDRTLVYGATTALVVGVVAAMNSLALRATLGENTGLLLQIIIPLSLGIVLGKVRSYMDRIVERVFFRSKYLAERALKNFARHAGHIEDEQRLLDAAVDEIRRHTHSPGVALYEVSAKGYARVRQGGDAVYPAKLHNDDPAVVAIRAEREPVELSDLKSKLGNDGSVIPIVVLGRVRGVLVLANRPGEHYANDEKKLLSQVVRDVGAAWRILRARENEQFVWALAQGEIKSTVARNRAKALASSWSGPPVSA
jgi:hypothetical protein